MTVYFGPNLILLDKLASGGMGEVFRARQIGTGGFQKTVAVKRILPQYAARADFADMFQREMNLCARLQHPNIVQVFSNGREAGYLYLVMEFVNGKSVAEVLIEAKRRKLRIPPEVSCFIICEVAQGLAYAHAIKDEASGSPLDVVHRDVSPQNIMLGFGGEVKVVDFGIAKAADRIEKEKAGDLKGKVPYAAPEYINGKVPDHRADIFALGVVFHELLAQRPLFSAENTYKTIHNVLEMEIPSLVGQFPDIRFELESIVMHALERNPEERYQNAQEMYRAVAVFMNKAYPNFTRTEFTRYVNTIFSTDNDPAVARLRDLYGYAKQVPARLVEAATNSINLGQEHGTGMFTKLVSDISAKKIYLLPIIFVLALIAFWVTIPPRQPSLSEASPTEVANLISWLKAEDAEKSGVDKVEMWKDASWLESSAGQNQPDRQPTIISKALGKYPVVHFDGMRSFLSSDGVAESLARSKNISLFYVARLVAQQGVPQFVWAAQTKDHLGDIMKGGFAFGNRARLKLSSNKETALFDDSGALDTRSFATYSVIIGNQRATAYQNGREIVIAPLRTPIQYEQISTFSIGQAYENGKEGAFFAGDLAELLIYSRALNDSERAKIERYLGRKYGIGIEAR